MSRLPSESKIERYFSKYGHELVVPYKYHLSSSDVEPLRLPELLAMASKESRAMWDNLDLGYTDLRGLPALRQEVSTMYENVTEDDVLILCPQEGIYIAMHCLADYYRSSDKIHVISTFPAYQSLYENLKNIGCEISYWTAKLTSSGWTFDMEELAAMVKDNTCILVVNFPHNPTGFNPTPQMWQTIVDLCKTNKIFLFSDEMYRWTNQDDTPIYPSAVSIYENSITLCGVSKSFALAGLRLGWVATRNKQLMDKMEKLKDYVTMCPPAPSEILALICLQNRDQVLARTLKIINNNIKAYSDFFPKYPELFDWFPPKAGATGLLRLKSWLLKLGEGGAMGFCMKLKDDCGILALPSQIFDFPDEYIRLGLVRKNIPEQLPLLDTFIQANAPTYT